MTSAEQCLASAVAALAQLEPSLPLATVRRGLAELSATGAVVMCSLTRYEDGKTIEALQCRLSGYVPKPAPGRKAQAQKGR